MARDALQRNIGFVGDIKKASVDERTLVVHPSRPPAAYIGRYCNSIVKFFTDVELSPEGLQTATWEANRTYSTWSRPRTTASVGGWI